ncbi:aminotransferase class I/II-fold pyridoxal phosphate-dependent enzyme [Solwaraspora sp. WMMD791]|uniref:aminotransferase class I/II-fold pyridoxal phosphate-dependent enzyme n=1 Tax=Solwaraspora sp. WMMD791 TaxID=3016086 RepID=UPI00249ABBAB|nr:aminotransferase class I/II-fold pyridoxal phosphate-dependent enzyme [Solwaraspora sp. WMMD791]WFE29886.1 aminotransferase class I/II-fold pyridoxal phosphate-dependent enzyme [Solwaraspora sp. WMMD791]
MTTSQQAPLQAAPQAPLRAAMRPFGVSVFSRVTELATRHSAINLAQGFPDFDPPAALIGAAEEAMRQHVNQYAPSPGLPVLRRAVAAHSERHYGVGYDPDTEVTITAGATEAMWSATTALLEPGDEAVIIEPYYETYAPCVVAAGGTVRFVPTTFPDFQIDLDRLAAAFSPRTRLVFVNSPGNPSGRLITPEEYVVLAELAERYDAYLISDETYEHLTYDRRSHLRASAVPGCRDRTLVLSSASKTFSATGWRVGWVLAPPPVTEAIRRVHQFVTFAAPSPLQWAVAAALDASGYDDYLDELAADYHARRDVLLSYLARTELSAVAPEGGYFVMARCPGDDVAWCEDLAARVRVAAIPGSAFYHDRSGGRDLVRFAFCKQLPTLHEAGARLTGQTMPTG